MTCRPTPAVVRQASRQVVSSDSISSGFPSSDPDGLLDTRNENFAVSDPTRLCGPADRLDGLLDHVVTKNDFDLHLGKKIDHVLGAAVEFRMSLLAAEPLGLGDGYPLQAYFLERLLDLIKFERLDDRLDFFHRVSSPGSKARRQQLHTRNRRLG